MASETRLRDDRLYLVEGWGVCRYQADGDLFFSWSEHGESDMGTPASEETAYELFSLPALYAALEAACQQAEGAATEKAVSAGLGVSEWEALVPPWFSSARAALAQARGEDA